MRVSLWKNVKNIWLVLILQPYSQVQSAVTSWRIIKWHVEKRGSVEIASSLHTGILTQFITTAENGLAHACHVFHELDREKAGVVPNASRVNSSTKRFFCTLIINTDPVIISHYFTQVRFMQTEIYYCSSTRISLALGHVREFEFSGLGLLEVSVILRLVCWLIREKLFAHSFICSFICSSN